MIVEQRVSPDIAEQTTPALVQVLIHCIPALLEVEPEMLINGEDLLISDVILNNEGQVKM